MKTKTPITRIERAIKAASVRPRLKYAGIRVVALIVALSVIEIVTV
jgi:hypothetical protein